MTAFKKAVTAVGCSHCRASVLNLFITTTVPVSRIQTHTPWLQSLHTAPIFTGRGFSSSTDDQSLDPAFNGHDAPLDSAGNKSFQLDEIEEKLMVGAREDEQTDAKSSSEAPWYLQVEPPTHAPAAEPGPLPEVPHDSPPLIKPILDYAAEVMGVDHISLMDLRELDPGSVLGPDLFMFFGTARSERHLHVSASRLVRWLRVNYKIHADADGLLGPNERKVKLKRKVKRAKLMGTMGNDETDDGISTGWVCVNLGSVDRSKGDTVIRDEKGRVTGFGAAREGSTIIFQIMTESRRAEMDLETLWQRALERSMRKQARENEEPHLIEAPHSEEPLLSHSPTRPTFPPKELSNTSHIVGSNLSHQHRSFSTSCISRAKLEKQAISEFKAQMDNMHETLEYDGKQKEIVLQLLERQLNELQGEKLTQALDPGPFMRLANTAIKNYPPEKTWNLRSLIVLKARTIGHPDFQSIQHLQRLVREFRILSLPENEIYMLQLLQSILTHAPEVSDPMTGEPNIDPRYIDLALEVLESTEMRGDRILTAEIFITMIEAINARTPRPTPLQLRLEDLMTQVRLPCPDERQLLRLMDVYQRQLDFNKFWDVFRMPPRFLRPRSADFYLETYRMAAKTKFPLFCADAIRRCFHEAPNENPPVRHVGPVRDAILDCIRVADPAAEELAETLRGDADVMDKQISMREFVVIARAIRYT